MASLATKYSISHGAQCISSGVKAIDELIGGGYPLGSVVLVDSDPTLFHSELLLKYFLSQGLYNHEDLYVCSQLDASNYCDNLLSIIRSSSTLRQQSKSSASLAKGPPGRSSLRSEIIPEEEPSTEAKNDDMKIAWRYKDSGKKSSRLLSVGAGQSSFRKASKGSELSLKPLEISMNTVEYCSHFDLHMNPKKELLQEARDAKRLDGLKVNFGFESELLLKSLKAKLQDLSSNQILRIGISNFGSPEWFAEDSALDMARQLFKTLFSLKKQISGTNAVIVVSMSQSLLEAIGAYHTLLNICDISLSLNAFRENDTSPYAKDYSGIIKLNKLNSITKISPVTSLVQGLPCFTQTEFGFKLKRKRFYVDVLSLPPLDGDDGKESKENEKKNVNCSSTAWKTMMDPNISSSSSDIVFDILELNQSLLNRMEKIQHVLKDVNLLSGVIGHDHIQKGLQGYVAAESELNWKLVRSCKTSNNTEFLFFTLEQHFRKNLLLLSELNWLLQQASEEIVTSENSSLLLTMLGADKNTFTFIPEYLSEFLLLLQKLKGSKAKGLMAVIYDVLKDVSLYQQSKAAIQRWHSIFKDLMASRRFLEIITTSNETLSQDYNSNERSVIMECKIAADCHVVLITDALLIMRRNMFRWELIRWLCLKDIVSCKSASDFDLVVYFSTKTVKMVLIFEDYKSLISMKNSIDTALSSKRVLRRKSCSELRSECIEHETFARDMSTSCPTLNFKVSQHIEEAAYQTDSGYSSTESFHKNHEENLDKKIAQIFSSPTKIIPTPPSSRKPVSMNKDPRLSRYVRKK